MRWLAVCLALALAFVGGVTPGFAQQLPSAPGVGAWAPGPAASGDRNSLAGVIDAPASGATLTSGNLQVSGWFVDLTAQGWAGVDDVEIFTGTMESGGRPLGHAQFGQTRADVAGALKNGFWAPSGWTANVSTASLPLGPTTLSAYVHTPAKGWWARQVTITLRAPPPPPPPPPSAPTRGAPPPQPASPPAPPPALAPNSPLGNDISYPQCPTGGEPPGQAFAIVGVTGGRPFSPNVCLAREFAWALGSTSSNQAQVGLYVNTADPGPSAANWPTGATSPRACGGDWSDDCAYDYGWLSTQDAYARAVLVVGSAAAAQYPWWLDVESANSWSTDMANNGMMLRGALDYLRSVNVSSVGVYSTSTDWEALIGPPSPSGPFGGLLNWRPGPSGAQDAPSWCNRTVTGGRVKFVQFPAGGFDTDFACF